MILFSLLVLSVVARAQNGEEERCVVACASDGYVNIRQFPNASSAILGRLYNGAYLSYLGREGNWYAVSFYDQKDETHYTGYVSAKQSREKVLTMDESAYVEANAPDGYANVRSAPSSKAPIVYKLYNGGDRFEYAGYSGNWIKVYIEDKPAYVHYTQCKIIISGP